MLDKATLKQTLVHFLVNNPPGPFVQSPIKLILD